MSKIARLEKRALLGLQPSMVIGRLDEEDVAAIVKACDAFWLHPGEANFQAPHAELTAGDCSNGFINLRDVLSYTNLCELFARQLVDLLRDNYDGKINWVVGSDTAATGLSHDVARLLDARWYPMQKNPDKSQSLNGIKIPDGARVLHVEELMTTAKTSNAVRQGVKANNPEARFVPFLPVIIHRPALGECEEVDGSKVLWLAHYDIQKWSPADCPLCQAGSERLRPNVPENWAKLVATMEAAQG